VRNQAGTSPAEPGGRTGLRRRGFAHQGDASRLDQELELTAEISQLFEVDVINAIGTPQPRRLDLDLTDRIELDLDPSIITGRAEVPLASSQWHANRAHPH